MRLTAADKAQLHSLIDNDQPLPEHFCRLLFPRQHDAACERLLDMAQAGSFTVSAGGQLLSCSARFAQYFGFNSRDECLQGFARREAGPEHAYRRELLLHCETSTGTADFELQARRPDGGPVWLQVSTRRDEHTGLIEGMARDVSAARQAESTAQDLARFPGENPYPVLRISAEGVLLYANASSTALLHQWNCGPGERLPDEVAASAAAALAGGEPQQLEVRCGGLLYALLLVPIAAGGYVNAYGREVSAHQQALELLRASELQHRSVVESIPAGMHYYELNADGELVFTGANRAADEILRLDHSAFAGQPILAVFPLLAEAGIEQRYREIAAGGAPWFTEQVDYNSGEIQGSYAVWAFQTLPGKMVASFLDITGLKQKEAQIEQLNRQLSAANGELHAANAELLAVNTELIATNRVSAQALAELHASHEQLTAANEELRLTYALLDAAKQYAETIIETANVMIVGLDRDGRIKLVNAATEQVTGYPRSHLLGGNWFELIVPQAELPHVKELYDRWQRGESALPEEYSNEIIVRSGARRVIRWRNRVLNENGTITGTLSYGLDITDQLAAERALRDSEARYRMLFEAESDAIIAVDMADLSHIDANQAAVDLYGYSRAELLRLRATDLSAEPEETANRIQSATGLEHVTLRYHRKQDGTVFPVEITARVFEMEGRQVLLVAIRDITLRLAAQHDVEERERKLQSIFRTAPAGIGMTAHGVLREANASLCELTGYSAGELLGQSLRLLYASSEEYDRAGAEQLRQIEAHGTGTVEARWVRRDGTLIVVLLSSSPIDQRDLSQGVTFTALDITQRKTAEQELREAYGLLSQSNTQLEAEISERLRAHAALAQSEELFRLVVQSSYDVIVLVDSGGKLVYASPAIERVLGHEAAGLLGRDTLEFVHEDDRAEVAQELAAIARRANSGQPSVFRCRHADGHWVYLEAVGSNLLDTPGINAMLITARDISERIAHTAALRTSEQFLRAVLESAPLGISVRDRAGRLLSCNSAWQKIWAMSDADVAAEMQTERLTALRDGSGDQAQPWWEAIARVYRDGGTYLIPEVCTGDVRLGSAPWISQYFYAISGSSGEVDSVVVITQDITGRKLAEETLRESEEKFRTMTEQLTDVLYTIDATGTITFMSPSVATVFGWSAEEIVGRNFTEFVEPEDLPALQAQFSAAIATQAQSDGISLRLRRKDGQVIIVEATGVRAVRRGQVAGLTGLLRDVTQRQETQQKLRASKEELDRFFTIALDLLCIADTDGYFRRLNASWVHTLGWELEQLVDRSFMELVHPDDVSATLNAVAELRQGRPVVDFINRYRCRDGSYRWIEWRSVPYENKAIYAAARDITDKIEAEELRRRMEEQLRQVQKMEALGTLAGGIAHDFNNILFAIMGNAELLLEDLAHDAQATERLGQLLTASNRARDLVQQILAFSRQTHRQQLPVHMGNLVQEVAKLLRATLPAMIELRLQVEPLAHAVLADPSELHQVLMNLASNAAQAIGDQPGVLELALRQREPSERELQLYPQLSRRPYLELRVSDSGHGIPPEVLGRIFEPFFTTKEFGHGTGMGLAVVHGIVSKLGGSVFAASTPGQGTVMTVLLPVVPFAAEREARPEAALPRGSASVLLVEDDASIRRVIQHMLGGLGYRVVPCSAGREALELFSGSPDSFDAVLTDQSMPGMAGIELARELLTLRPGLPVVMVTGYSQSVTPDIARSAGIYELLYKPVTRQDLARVLQRALEQKQA